MPEYNLHELEALRLQREYQAITNKQIIADERFNRDCITEPDRRARHYKRRRKIAGQPSAGPQA